MPRRHPLALKKQLRVADLEGAELIVPTSERQHRIMLSRVLQSHGVEWQVAVEANGWELMLHFVSLGLGLAIVNDCCKIPSGLVSKPLKQLPGVQYHVFNLAGAAKEGPQAELKSLLSETATTSD